MRLWPTGRPFLWCSYNVGRQGMWLRQRTKVDTRGKYWEHNTQITFSSHTLAVLEAKVSVWDSREQRHHVMMRTFLIKAKPAPGQRPPAQGPALAPTHHCCWPWSFLLWLLLPAYCVLGGYIWVISLSIETWPHEASQSPLRTSVDFKGGMKQCCFLW